MDLFTTISSPRFFTSLWAPYLCKILRALIPGQEQSAFSTRAVSTVTGHIKAEAVKSQGDVCLSAWETVGEGCVRVRVHGGAQPDGHPTLVSLTNHASSPNPTLLTSARPLNLGVASHSRPWKSEASLLR